MADPDRKGGGGLSARTLAIASAASVTAAMVTSRLFPPGTIYASALTPVIVAAVSEMLNRPADAVTELRKQRRALMMEERSLETARVRGEEPNPLRGAPEFAQGEDAARELATNGNTAQPPVSMYGGRRLPRRILHPKVWIATGLTAFAIAVAVLTVPELIFGGAVTSGHQTTFFGGGSSSRSKTNQDTTTTPSNSKTQTQTTVTQTVTQQTQTKSETTTTPTQTSPTDTGTSTAPSGGTPAPNTATSTTPAPSGAATPAPAG